MVAIGYLRVSSEEQSRSGLGLDAQRDAIEVEIARRGSEVVWIEDRAASGKDMRRAGMQRALGMLKRGEADTLIAAKLDRISRSVFDFTDLMQRADTEGWSVVALDLGVDTSTANGRLVANVMASVADWERLRIGERTRDAPSGAQGSWRASGWPQDDLGRPQAFRLRHAF